MHTREDLSLEFHRIMDSKGYVYFQPPTDFKMHYPCIKYSVSDIPQKHANNHGYIQRMMYEGCVIDPNPESHYIHEILKLPGASYSNRSVFDNLYHDYFRIYF